MDHHQLPMLDMLLAHHQKEPISFHVPGHKNGQLIHRELPEQFISAFSWDVTELSGLDDLHDPEWKIKESEEMLSDAYQTDKSYFLVNGTTVGNLAMILGVVKSGEKVLVQRNCHKSIMNGLRMANARPVFLAPHLDENTGLAVGPEKDAVIAGIHNHPDCCAIILTYPNYYGFGFDLTDIIKEAHKYDIPVLVDEAHGAHFIAGSPFPPSALHMGADIVVQSAHKTLPAMTMSSYLHMNGSLVNKEKVEDYLRMLQSSSPSYPLMLSLDAARSYIATYTAEDSEYMLQQTRDFAEKLEVIAPLKVMKPRDDIFTDPLKLLIAPKETGTGYQLQRILEQAGIFTEMADERYVLFTLPLLKKGDSFPFQEVINRIKNLEWGELTHKNPFPVQGSPLYEQVSMLALTYEEMDGKKSFPINIKDAVGLAAAETIIPYPPGVPLIVRGEIITESMKEQCLNLLKNKAKVQGGSLLSEGQILIFGSL